MVSLKNYINNINLEKYNFNNTVSKGVNLNSGNIYQWYSTISIFEFESRMKISETGSHRTMKFFDS